MLKCNNELPYSHLQVVHLRHVREGEMLSLVSTASAASCANLQRSVPHLQVDALARSTIQ